MIEEELEIALSRRRYARNAKQSGEEAETAVGATGHRHGHRSRSLLGSFGQVEIEVPRARLNTPEGKTTEWKSKALRAYQRRTLVADALTAGTSLAGTNTRGVRRAFGSLFGGAVGKDMASRVLRKVKSDWDAWNAPSLARGTDRAAHFRRHRGARAARPQIDFHMPPRAAFLRRRRLCHRRSTTPRI